MIGTLGKFEMDLCQELLTPLIDAAAFLGQAASETHNSAMIARSDEAIGKKCSKFVRTTLQR